MENQKVLNGRVFDPDILTKFGISNLFDALATKNGDVKNAGLSKRFLKGKYQLFFEFIKKVASAADLFLMEKLDELEEINLSAIMLEHKGNTWDSIWLPAEFCIQPLRSAFGKRGTWYHQADVHCCYPAGM